MKRFDLLAIKKSYSNPMTWIYEIKVSRQNFLQDNKWQDYLKYCTDFYFVAPYGIIDVAEVPEGAGLLPSSKNGTRLYCKRKASHRNVEIPLSLYKYILMSRTKIVDSTYVNSSRGIGKKEYWQQWLSEKKENQELGYNVSNKIRQLYDKNVLRVKIKQDRLETRVEKLENAKRILKEIGFDGKNLGRSYEERLRKRTAEINAGFPENDVVEHLENAILNIKDTINVIQKGNKREIK